MSYSSRILILVLIIAATLGLSVASATHIDSSPNGCNICFVAHTVAFETPAVQPVHAPEIVGFAVRVALVFAYRACAARHVSSRGPPALLPLHTA
jgi:hypothetical protein